MQSKGDPTMRPLPRPGSVDELDADQRVTISSAPHGLHHDPAGEAPMSGEARTGSRATHPLTELPAYWLDRLLALATDLPIEEGEGAVARAVVAALASLLPRHAVGACFVPTLSVSASVTASVMGREVIRAMPDGEAHRADGNDPTRIFPGYSFERIAEIGATESTLHVACDRDDDAHPLDAHPLDAHSLGTPPVGTPPLGAPPLGANVDALVDRALAIATRGFARAREHARAMQAASELRAINAQMAQTEKLASLGQIAAGVVHELNNPLTSIVAYTDFLIRKVSSRGEGADADEVDRLRRIAESAGRMLRFTRDLVSYARPSSEVPVHVSVHNVIDQALAFCEHILNEAGVRVERRFASQVPHVRGKPEQLAQVFVNLVTNASHAMRAGGGELVIATESHGDRVKIVVADNGHGISKEHLPSVFAPFFTTKGSGVGTGLGLTIVKSIVVGHDGTIDVESADVPPVSGTAFTILLPAAP